MALPEHEDKLFIEDGAWQNTVDVNTSPRWGWFEYIHGYRKAADLLVDALERDSSIGAMNLAYPIINLYRHHLEIQLKSAIVWGAAAADIQVEVKKGHLLESLWKTLRELAERTHPSTGTESLDAAERCIHEFVKYDPRGTTFRYPDTPLSAAPLLRRVNLRHFVEIAGRVSDLIDAVRMTWSAMIDDRQEMDSDAAYYEAQLQAEAEEAIGERVEDWD